MAEPDPLPGMPDAPPAYIPFSYPQRRDQVTAERMAAHLTVVGMRQNRRHWDLVEQSIQMPRDGATEQQQAERNAVDREGAWAAAVLVQAYATVALIRQMQRRLPPQVVDEAVREVWDAWQSGLGVGTDLFDWAGEYGLPVDHEGRRRLPDPHTGEFPTETTEEKK